MNNFEVNQDRDEMELEVNYPAYYVESHADERENHDESVLLAIDIQLHDNYIEWYDTESYRKFIHDNIQQHESGSIEFINVANKNSYTLTPLTLDLYNQQVKDRVHGSVDFSSEDELWETLLNSVKNL